MRSRGFLFLLVAASIGCGSAVTTCQVTCTDGSTHRYTVTGTDGGDGGSDCANAVATVCAPAGTGTCTCQTN